MVYGFTSKLKQSVVIILLCLSTLLYGCLEQSQQNDPIAVLLDYPIAYVKRPIPVNNQGNPTSVNLLDLEDFNPGADLYLRDRASPSAPERNITFRFTGGRGDIKDVESSADGSKLIFALRAPEIENADKQPTWNIWQYEIATDTLTRIISSDISAEAGQDIAPHYLPDGRIVFTSTRQRDAGAVLLDEGKPRFSAETESRNGPAFVLHVMDGDGNNIKQISFNQSHDIDPTVSSDGDIIFGRWDNMGSSNAINLYKINADGTGLEIIYGAHSHNSYAANTTTIQYSQPRELENGELAARLIPFRGSNGSSRFSSINIDYYLDLIYPKHSNSEIIDDSAENGLMTLDLNPANAINPDGYVNAFYPLWDNSNRALISWSPCRLLEVDANQTETIVLCTSDRLAAVDPVAAPPLYGIYIYNLSNNTLRPIVPPEEDFIIHDVVATYERLSYSVPSTIQLNNNFADEGVGVLDIRSVYDEDGFDTTTSSIAALADPAQTTAAQRPARFLRIVKAVPLPDRDTLDFDNTAFGRSNQLMREIIGYAPIEPDGSVKVKVPANAPLAISVLDENGRRISARHQNWIQVLAGETKQCNGCHDHSSGIPHGNRAGPDSVYAGAAQTGSAFTNTDSSIRAEVTETMAQTLARISCDSDCAYLQPLVNPSFVDNWTDTNIRAKDTSFSYLYADMTTTAPTSAACQTSWTPLCRIIINYETHIHPLWSEARMILNPNTMVNEDRTCTSCHNNEDISSNPVIPDAQLDLSDGPSSDEADHFKSYRELLFADNEQELVNNILQDIMVQATDNQGNLLFETDADGEQILGPGGNPVPIMIPVPAVGPSMSANGANNSYFFDRFDTGGSHAGWLSPAELRLLSEWLDIGAQYYNNPFDMPLP